MDKDLWERYKHDVDLHRSYLDLVIKINTFYYAITGAIVSFYFLHYENKPLVQYALILPFIMTIALAVFYWRCATAANISQKNLDDMAQELGFSVGSVVAKVLSSLLMIFFWLFVLTALGLTFLLFEKQIAMFMDCIS
ncbi:MAG: hypothetical protein KJ017_01610 [Alphaproteobacteria bacterium]|nr:hypothetical protein [Alphaproteobacteria bacterium]